MKEEKNGKYPQETEKDKYKVVTQGQPELIAFWFSSQEYFFADYYKR